MPKSKTHYKRKMKQRDEAKKMEKWARRKVDTMTPEEMAARWGFAQKDKTLQTTEREPHDVVGGLSGHSHPPGIETDGD